MAFEENVFLVSNTGSYERMNVVTYNAEEDIQLLIAQHPDLISGGYNDPLILITREMGVPGESGGGDRWSIDHLFVTREAVPVLVEVKRATDTRIRREVVGQMLDYAANGSAYWDIEQLVLNFEKTYQAEGVSSEQILEKFLGDDKSVENFWEQLAVNLKAGRMRLLFVADSLPSELIRIIEFMSEHMTQDVLGIEIQSFENEQGIRVIAPKIVGYSERAQSNKKRRNFPKLTVEEWLDFYIAEHGEKVMTAFKLTIKMMEEIGAKIYVASSQGSLTCGFEHDGKRTYPFFLRRGDKPMLEISFAWVWDRPSLLDERIRQDFYNRFEKIAGPLTTKNLKGSPSFDITLMLDKKIREEFEAIAKEFSTAAR